MNRKRQAKAFIILSPTPSAPKTDWVQAGEPVSADLLSTQTAGGFTGTMVGIYATGDYNEQGD